MQGKQRTISFLKGQNIYSEGEVSDGLFVIQKGTVEIYRERSGHCIPITQVGPGQIIGDLDGGAEGKRVESVKALTDGVAVHIQAQSYKNLFEALPPWSRALINTLAERVRNLSQTYLDLAFYERISQVVQHRPLREAMNLAKELALICSHHEVVVDEVSVVDFGACLKELVETFPGKQGRINRVFELFQKEGLVKLCKLSTPGKYLMAEELKDLTVFRDTAQEHLRLVWERNRTPLAIGERKKLAAIAAVGELYARENPNQHLDLEVRKLEDGLLKHHGLRYEDFLIQRGVEFKLLQLSKQGGEARVLFNPRKLQKAIASMEVIHGLERD